jgi:hypothetical protein
MPTRLKRPTLTPAAMEEIQRPTGTKLKNNERARMPRVTTTKTKITGGKAFNSFKLFSV